jgi:hypothetical protein
VVVDGGTGGVSARTGKARTEKARAARSAMKAKQVFDS